MKKKKSTKVLCLHNKWCLRAESNRRHKDFQSFALPTELPRHTYKKIVAVRTRLELATSCVTGRHSNQLNYRTTIWLREKDLNQRPPGYEPGELPDCSIPRYEWRRKRDLNPRGDCSPYRFSRPNPSATWVFLRDDKIKI